MDIAISTPCKDLDSFNSCYCLSQNVYCVRTLSFSFSDVSYYTFVNEFGAPLFCESFKMDFGIPLPSSVSYEAETPLVKYIHDLGIT